MTGVKLKDIYPSWILSFDSSNPVYTAISGDIYTRDIGTLLAGQTGMIVITGTVLDTIT